MGARCAAVLVLTLGLVGLAVAPAEGKPTRWYTAAMSGKAVYTFSHAVNSGPSRQCSGARVVDELGGTLTVRWRTVARTPVTFGRNTQDVFFPVGAMPRRELKGGVFSLLVRSHYKAAGVTTRLGDDGCPIGTLPFTCDLSKRFYDVDSNIRIEKTGNPLRATVRWGTALGGRECEPPTLRGVSFHSDPMDLGPVEKLAVHPLSLSRRQLRSPRIVLRPSGQPFSGRDCATEDEQGEETVTTCRDSLEYAFDLSFKRVCRRAATGPPSWAVRCLSRR